MMKLILTEKPSVAKDFQKVLGGNSKDGFIEGPDFCITWALGHLIEISKKIYPNTWSFDDLPSFPANFHYEIVKDKERQFNVIKSLISRASEIIIATDAGREGELIARLILNACNWNYWNKTYRFWSSEALSEKVIVNGLKELNPSSNFDSLYYSANTRQQADWLTGINLTMAVTIKANDRSVWSMGRVQSPTLKLVVDRDIEISHFKKELYYKIKIKLIKNNIEFVAEYKNPNKGYLPKDEAISIVGDIKDEKVAIVNNVSKEIIINSAPLLHSLTSLQIEANISFGYSAEETLNLAQNLYEKHKCISYPRTDSQHLADDNIDFVLNLIDKFNLFDLKEAAKSIGKKIFDSTKLTDHHAIIPLDIPPVDLPADENKIYNLIFRRFKGIFMKDYTFEKTLIDLILKDHVFIANGKLELEIGWKSLYKEEKEERGVKLPLMVENEPISKINEEIEEKYTTPPVPQTEASLLNLMDKHGLGTPATRAAIIEKLLAAQYITRNKKNLMSSEKAKELIRQLGDNLIMDYDMTAQWETKLEKIYKDNLGKAGQELFLDELKNYIHQEIKEIESKNIIGKNLATTKMLGLAKKLAKEKKLKLPESTEFEIIQAFIKRALEGEVGECACGELIKDSLKTWNCACGKLLWKEQFSKKLTTKNAVDLFNDKTIELKNLTAKSGKKFDCKAKLNLNKLELIFN